MAKITDYSQTERPAPRIGGGGSPSTGFRSDDSTSRGVAAQSQDIQQGLEEVYRAVKVEEERIDTLRAEEAFTSLRERQLDLSIGETGFTKLKGSQVVGRPVVQEYGKRWEDAEREVGEGLANDRQRLKFKARSQTARLQYNEDILRHLGREGETYAKEVYDGALATEQRNATARWDSPNDVASAIVRIRGQIDARAERYGWSKEQKDAELQQQQGKIHASVIGQAVAAGNYRYAEQWYKANKEDIDPSTAKILHHAVLEGTQKELAAGYNAEYLANENSIPQLQELHGRITLDGSLDEQRRNVLVGRVQNRMAVLEHRAELGKDRQLRVLQHGINALNANTLAGFEPTAEQFAPMIAAARGTELEGAVTQSIKLADATRHFRSQLPAVQERLLAEAEAGVRKDPSKFDRNVVGAWRTIYEAQRTQVNQNPIAYGVRQGIVEPLQPLDLSDPRNQGPALAQRFAIGRSMQARYQAPFKPLTSEEATLVSSSLKLASAHDKRTYFAGLAQAAGDDYAGYSAIMGQLAPDDPVTAVAGTYAYRGRTAAADLMLRGQQVLHPLKKEDGKPDQGKLWPMPPDKDLRANWQGYERDAFAGHPGARNAMYQGALAIYAAKSVDDGDSTGVLNTGRWEESMRLATGGIEKHKGRAIVLPYGQEYGQFRDGLRGRIDILIERGEVPPGMDRAKLEDMPLEAIGDGRYVFKAGDGVLSYTPKGDKAQIKNKDGSVSTERTITIEVDGKHLLVPTIVGGKQLSEDDAVRAWHKGKNPEVGTYETAAAADAAAQARTAKLSQDLGPRPVIIDFNMSLPYRFSGDHLQPKDREPTPQELEAARQPVTGRAAPEAAGRRQPPAAAPARGLPNVDGTKRPNPGSTTKPPYGGGGVRG